MMNTRKIGLSIMLLALAAPAWPIGFPEFEDIQATQADPSPIPAISNINDYTQQNDRLDVSPDDGVVKVLRTDQKILVQDYVTAVFPLANVHRREIRNVMRRVTAMEGGRAEVFQDKSTNESFLQVIAPRFMIPYLRQAVAGLDEPWVREYTTGANSLYARMLHRPAAAVDRIAASYAGNQGFSVIDRTNNAVHRYDEIYRNEEYARAVALVDIPCNMVELRVRVYELAVADDLKLGLDYLAWANGPGRQLFIFAEEGARARQRARGATSIFDPFADARATVPTSELVTVVDTELRAGYRAANFLLTSNFVDFLETRRQARVINEQTLLLCSANTGEVGTQDQVLAQVVTPQQVNDTEVGPFFLQRENRPANPADGTGAAGRIFIDVDGDGLFNPAVDTVLAANDWPRRPTLADSERRLDYRNAGTVGLNMRLTPFVGIESMELAVDLELGELNGVAPNGTPIINTRTVATTVRLLDGQPYVIAGLRRRNHADSTARMPGLGALPGLGWVFGGEQRLGRRQDIVVTIEPRFILASQHTQALAPRVEQLGLIVDGRLPQGAAPLQLGYDQWLLDM